MMRMMIGMPMLINCYVYVCVRIHSMTIELLYKKKSDEQPKKSILLSILLDLIPLYYCSFVHLHTN